MTIMAPASRSRLVSPHHSDEEGTMSDSVQRRAKSSSSHDIDDIDSSYEEDLSDTVRTDDSDVDHDDVESVTSDNNDEDHRGTKKTRASPRPKPSPPSKAPTAIAARRRQSMQRAMSESSMNNTSSRRRARAMNESSSSSSQQESPPTRKEGVDPRQRRLSMSRAKSDFRLTSDRSSRQQRPSASNSNRESSTTKPLARARRESVGGYGSRGIADEHHAGGASARLKDARQRNRRAEKEMSNDNSSNHDSPKHPPPQPYQRRLPRRSLSADQTNAIIAARSAHQPRRRSSIMDSPNHTPSPLQARSEHRPTRRKSTLEAPALASGHRPHRRISSMDEPASESPSQPRQQQQQRRRTTIRSANPMASVLQIQLAQAVVRHDLEEAAGMDSSSSERSHLSVDIDCDDDDDGTPVLTDAEKLLLITQRKKEMMMRTKSLKNFKSTKKVQATLDDFEEEDMDPQQVNIVVEIVKGNNLIIADTTTSDPFVLVKMGDKDIHKTAKILKTLNPHWTPESRSTFMLSCKHQQLLATGGILFKVKDWNFLGGDDPMGEVFVKAKDLLKGKGELKDYKIKPPQGMEGVDAGTLTIRYRKGTRADYESLKNKEKKCLFVPQLDRSIPEKLSIMIEIQSARNILIGDTTTSDPYVLVKAGDKNIHKTSKIMKTLNPDWTPELRNTFVLDCDAKSLFGYGGLSFKLYDWDFIGGDDPLGHVFLSAKELCEERVLREYPISPPKGQEGVNSGTMTIHFRRANEADRLLLQGTDIVSWVHLPCDKRS